MRDSPYEARGGWSVDEELVVLCDEAGAAIGTQPKASVHHDDTPLHLAFSCYLFDSDGRFLVTRRASHKKTWPGVRTNSCCGHPAPGEPLTSAIARRLQDELGIGQADLQLVLPRFRYRAVMEGGTVENELCPVYRGLVPAGSSPTPNPDEVDDAWWVPWESFVADVLERGDISPWAALQMDQLAALGRQPHLWQAADDAELPRAARTD